MDKTALAKRLESVGLPEKDAQTYIALLSLGPTTVQQIADETGLNRSSLYVVLDRLLKRRLVTVANGNAVKRYTAAPPDILAQVAKERASQSLLLLQNLITLAPQLEETHRGGKLKPRVSILEGKTGLKKGFEDALACKEGCMRVFSSTKDIFESLPEYLPLFVQKRLERGLKMYGIHPDDETAREVLRRVPNNLDKITLIPKEDFHFPADLAVYDDKVSFMSHKPPFCVQIEGVEIAEVIKVAFDLAQKQAEHLQLHA